MQQPWRSPVDRPFITTGLREAILDLPPRLRKRFENVCEQIEHWAVLREEALRLSEETIADLRIENAYLQFDVEATLRERDGDERPSRGEFDDPTDFNGDSSNDCPEA